MNHSSPEITKSASVKSDQRPASIINPSHEPARYPEKPLPLPAIGERGTGSDLLHDPASLELERRMTVAGCFGAEPKIVHHPECSFETSSGRASSCVCLTCDCGPLFLTRLNGQTFAIMPDCTLERFTERPPSPEKFRADPKAFFLDLAWDVPAWVLPLMADHLEFTIAGDGEREHFVELPIESKIETRKAPEL